MTPNNIYTRHLLHDTPLQHTFYIRDLLYQTPFTPETWCTKRFYTRHLLHQKPFNTKQHLHQTPLTPGTLYAKQLLHQTTFTPDIFTPGTFYTFFAKHRFTTNVFYATQLLHQTPLTPDNFYTKHLWNAKQLYNGGLLHQTPFTPEIFIPEAFYTSLNTLYNRNRGMLHYVSTICRLIPLHETASYGRMCRGSDTDSRTLRPGRSFLPLYHRPLFDTTGEEPQSQTHSRLRCRFIPLYQTQSFGTAKLQ